MEKKQLFQQQKEVGYMGTNKWRKWILLFMVMLSACLAGILPVHAGKKKAMGFLVGQTMKAMKGKADPGMVNRILEEILNQ